MNKYLRFSLISLCLGSLFLLLAFLYPSKSIFAGLVGAFFTPAFIGLYKYSYWKKRPLEYQDKIENDNIEIFDERKEMIRGKTLKISTLINGCILSALLITITLLEQFEVISSEVSRPLLIVLAAYWIISYGISWLVYKYLSKKY